MSGIQGLMQAPGQGQPPQAPGQAAPPGQGQPPMPGMQPGMGGPQGGVQSLTPALAQMNKQQLLMEMMNPNSQIPKFALLSAIDQKVKQEKAMQAVQGSMAQGQNAQNQQQGSVAQGVLQEAMQGAQQPPTQMARHGGVMHGYADGGAVAFQFGGITDTEKAELISRGMTAETIDRAIRNGLGYEDLKRWAFNAFAQPAISPPEEPSSAQDASPVSMAAPSAVAPQGQAPLPAVVPQTPTPPQTPDEKELVELVRGLRELGVSTADITEDSILNSYRKNDPAFREKRLQMLRDAYKRHSAKRESPPTTAPAAAAAPTGIAQGLSDDFAAIGAPPGARPRIFDPAIDRVALEREKARVAAERAGVSRIPPGGAITIDGDPAPRFTPAIDQTAIDRLKVQETERAATAPQRQDTGGGSADLTMIGGVMPPQSSQPVSGVPALITEYQKILEGRGAQSKKLAEAESGLDKLMRDRIAQEEKFGTESLAETRRAAQEAIERSREFGTREWLEVLASINPKRGYELSSAGKGAATALGRQEQAREAARKELAGVSKDERALQSKLSDMRVLAQQAQVERERGNVKRAEDLEDKAMALRLDAAKYADKLGQDKRELDIKELQAGKMSEIDFYLKHGPEAYRQFKTAGTKPVVPLTYQDAFEGVDKFLNTVEGSRYVRERQDEAKRAGQPVPDAVMIREQLIQRFLRDAGVTSGAAPAGGAARPRTQAEFDALPKGTRYINPSDNKEYIKK